MSNRPEIKQHKQLVRQLGEAIGYGNLMSLASDGWREALERDGFPSGGEFSLGPCVAMLVPCPGCIKNPEPHCDWCCGTHKVTQKVAWAIRRLRPST